MRAAVICHTSELALVVLRSLRANGVEPYVLCDPRIERVLASSRACAGVVFSGDLSSPADLIAAIRRLHRRAPLGVAMASNVQGQRILHAARSDLPMPTYPMASREALDVLDDKTRFYSLAAGIGLPVPRSLEFESRSAIDVGLVSRRIGYPAAVKPAVSWASIGFRRVGSEAELRALAEDRTYAYRKIVVQEFVEGQDVGVGLFARGGKVEAAATFKCGPRDAAEFVAITALAEAAARIAAQTAYEGVANFDARLGPSGAITLLECNPRFFMRLRAARLCGLDFLAMGLPGGTGRPNAARGRYRPLGDVVSAAGLGDVFKGRWDARVLARTAVELAADPMPALLGRLGSGRTVAPPASY